jgi:hypothetical protein
MVREIKMVPKNGVCLCGTCVCAVWQMARAEGATQAKNLHIWESVSGKDGLSGNSTDRAHGETSVKELRFTLFVECGLVFWGELRQSKV